MKAAILVNQKASLAVDEVQVPEPSYGQALVKVCYSGICGSQLGEIDGAKGEDPYLPHLLGHEGSGIVVETGPGVKSVKASDHVVLHWMKGKGIESEPPVYQWRNQRLNAGWVTTFNEYALVSENRVTAIPLDFDLEVAALLGCAVTTGLGVVNNNACLKIGESVVVLGVGGVGLNVVQGAALVSANPIIAVDLYENKLRMAQHFGATHIINSQNMDPTACISEILRNVPPDVVVDTTGNSRVIELAYNLTAPPHGRTILVGVPPRGDNISIHSLSLHFGKVLTGSHGGETNPSEDIPRYIGLAEVGTLRLKDMITSKFPLEEINLAIAKVRSGETVGKCLIDMST